MNTKTHSTSAAARYDKALRRGRALSAVPAGCPEPQPTSAWPAENVALLERYREWLVAGGAAESVINHHRIPMAGYVLGLNLKPHARLHLETDLEKGMAYAESKQLSASWLRNCRHSLRWFRRFLLEERCVAMTADQTAYGDATRYQAGLPAWLLAQLQKLLTVRRANWRPSRQAVSTYQFWQKYTRVWRWLLEQGVLGDDIDGLTAIRRRHLDAYMDAMLAQGYAVGSVNLDLYTFQGCLRFLLEERGVAMPANQATYGDATRYQAGLPAWLLAQLQKLLIVRRANWRPSRQAVSTYQFWQKYTRVWRWLVEQGVLGDEVGGLTAIRRGHLEAYMDAMLAQGYAVGSVNLDLYNFQGCLRFLQGRGHKIPAALLAMQGL
ncbi:MAG: hypothetical protein KC425_07160, partial [Anaerolineales bacterium]|nr:hypothetical protein [Anaerolineales bacterium]